MSYLIKTKLHHICSAVLSLWGLALLCGCANKGADAGTQAATDCARSDLVAQCPINTTPQLEIDAESACSASGSIDVTQGSDSLDGGGAVQNACVGSGSCRLVCTLNSPCQWGIQQISPTDGILCAEAPDGCGNGQCDAGETPATCPNDCEMECTPGQGRCDGDGLQSCNLRGQWEGTLACPSGQRCVLTGGQAQCAVAGCGNGFVDIDEDCDDGPNNADTERCTTMCKRARCGDGLVWNGQEQCDDGNESNTDACVVECRIAICGDGFIYDGQEECDDGNLENADACTNACEDARCGDGIERMDLDINEYEDPGFEACDDGNDEPLDDCNGDCIRTDLNGDDAPACDNPTVYEGKMLILGRMDRNIALDIDRFTPSSDVFSYIHNCTANAGADGGALCEQGGSVSLNFYLRYEPPMDDVEYPLRSMCKGTYPIPVGADPLSRIHSQTGHCCHGNEQDPCTSWFDRQPEADGVFSKEPSIWQKFYVADAYQRDGLCV